MTLSISVDLFGGLHYNVIMQSFVAGAKINLALNVLGQEKGMHLLDGIYVTCRFGDEISLAARTDDEISVRYVSGERYEKDAAFLMAKRLQRRYGTPGMDVVIQKHIPEMRGLGGSSADAAGVAVAFRKEFGFSHIDEGLLLEGGSDVPFQYVGGFARVTGRGEKISPLDIPGLYVALLCPPRGVSTAECFALYDTVGGDRGDVEELIRQVKNKEEPTFFNGLERAATILVEEIGRGKRILEDAGFRCGMTGSGSALFAVEYDERVFREKLKKVIVPQGYTLTKTVTEGEL